MQDRKTRERRTGKGGRSLPKDEEKGNESKKNKPAEEPCEDSETLDSVMARQWQIPEIHGIVLEKA